MTLSRPALRLPADACADLRPGWDGTPVSAWAEALALFATPAALALLLATALVLRFRSPWGALAVCVAWSGLISAFTFFDPTGGLRDAAAAQGCVGKPTLFIALVAALCGATILYAGRPHEHS